MIKKPPPESGEQGDHVLREAERYPHRLPAPALSGRTVNELYLLIALPSPREVSGITRNPWRFFTSEVNNRHLFHRHEVRQLHRGSPKPSRLTGCFEHRRFGHVS